MTGTPILFFPAHADRTQAEAYASRYVRTVQPPETSAEQADEEAMQAWVQSAVGSRPATLDAEAGLLALPSAQQEVLTQKLRVFLRVWRQVYPLLDGEELLSEQVTFTAESWAGYSPSILFYERKTDQGELALILPYVHIDPQTGQIAYYTTEHGVLPELVNPMDEERLMTASPDAIDITQSVLGMITWVGMACGPAGMVVAAGAGILEIILSLVRPRASPVNLPKIVDDIMKQDLAEDHVLKNITTILSYTNWLSDQNMNALKGTMSNIDPAKYKEQYKKALADLRGYVADACNPGMPLLQAIGDLRQGAYPIDPSYQILGLAAFLLGASTHLLFEVCRVLFLTDATTFRSPITYELVSAAKRYLEHTRKVVVQIEEAFATRLGGIHDPQQYHYDGNKYMGGGWSVTYLYIVDDQVDTYPKQERVPLLGTPSVHAVWSKDCSPDGCASKTFKCDWDSANSWKTGYVARVTSGLEKKYNYSAERKVNIHKVIAELEKVIKQYEPLAK